MRAPKAILLWGPLLRVFSLFSPRGNNFFSKLFLIKVSHFINKYLEQIRSSLMLTLWYLEQKMGAPKVILLWGPLLRVFSLFSPRGSNFFSKLFLIIVSHFITKYLEQIRSSLMMTLWCLGKYP